MAAESATFAKPPSIGSKSPYTWSTSEVCGWIVSLNQSYKTHAHKFQTANIDGSELFTLDRKTLQNDIKIFDAKDRNAILTEIDNLKKRIKKLQKDKIEKFASTHTRRESKKKLLDEDMKSDEIEDIAKNRKYIKIKKNNNTSDIGSNYTIQSILEHYDFKNNQLQKEMLNNEDLEDIYTLKHCALNHDKKKSVFMFIICNIKTKQYLYLFTKNIPNWNILNVFEFIRNISNRKFVLFADEVKRKNVDGKKLLKYDQKKLRTEYGNSDAATRKKMMDEINLLKQQMNVSNDTESEKDRKPKTYHSTHKRTTSQIERDRVKRQKMKKAGPREIGKIKYHGTKYDESKDKAFLEDTIHPLSKDDKFQKRKKRNPAPKKEKVTDIGKIHGFKGTKYDDSKDAGFLADRINPLSKDSKFQRRKELNPTTKKPTVKEIGKIKYDGVKYDGNTDSPFLSDRIHALSKDDKFQKRKAENPVDKKAKVSEIGKIHGFKGTKYDDSEDAGFLADRINPLSKDSKFQKRKELNPTSKKQTVEEIGKIKYDGVKYDDSNDAAFLQDRINPLSKDERFQKRKELNPTAKKQTVSEIGKNADFKGPDWKLEDVVDDDAFLSTDGYYRQRTAQVTNPDGKVSTKLGPTEIGRVEGFKKPEWSAQIEQELKEDTGPWTEKVKKEDKDYEKLASQIKKKGAVEVGKIKDFDGIDYELTEEEMMGGFLKEKLWFDSSKVSQQFDEGISHLLSSLPVHKARIMYDVPLPTGVRTRIAWLNKLRDIIEEEIQSQKVKEMGNEGGDESENEDGAMDDEEVEETKKVKALRETQLIKVNQMIDALNGDKKDGNQKK